MSVGELIKIYITENKIKQTWLSLQTGIMPSKLSASLNGKRKLSIDEYKNIVRALALPVDKFLK